ADSFDGLATWHEPARLLELARVAVAPRAGAPGPDLAAFDAAFPGRRERVVVFDAPPVDVSASAIRRRAARGESLDGLVPPAVAAVIRADRLYRQPRQPTPRRMPEPVTESIPHAGGSPGPSTAPPPPPGPPHPGPAAARPP